MTNFELMKNGSKFKKCDKCARLTEDWQQADCGTYTCEECGPCDCQDCRFKAINNSVRFLINNIVEYVEYAEDDRSEERMSQLRDLLLLAYGEMDGKTTLITTTDERILKDLEYLRGKY